MARTAPLLALCLGASAVVSASTTSAWAKIRCQGPNQIITPYGAKPTPYCEDEYLAQVARGYGMHVSGYAIRQNINVKARVCRLVGHDIRVQNICSSVTDDGRRGKRWP